MMICATCWKPCGPRKWHEARAALAVLLSTLATALACAEEPPQKTAVETAVSVGLGDNSHTSLGGGNVRENITFVSLMFSRGKVFKELDRGRSLQWAAEGSVSRAEQEADSRRAIGVTPLFLYNFKSTGRITAFAEAGLGLLYTDLDPERFGSSFNFTPQAGIGIRYHLTDERSIRLAYRLHHISNGGLDDDNNRSIDSHFLIFGISFRR
jgi:opacity protein-like surface antigen